jgi:predicted dehydrogenase
MPGVQLAVLGAGLIGERHAAHVAASTEAVLAAVVDPAPAGREIASRLGARWYPDFAAMRGAFRPDGVIVATPTRMHVEHGLACVADGIPALIEKPIADDLVDAARLVEAAERAGVALLVGHHRRHNPMIRRAKAIIDSGRLGRIVAVHGFFWVMKPEDYFDTPWRREPGAGPVLTNLIHDVDLLRHLWATSWSCRPRRRTRCVAMRSRIPVSCSCTLPMARSGR